MVLAVEMAKTSVGLCIKKKPVSQAGALALE
jgi:hypothetical protein